MPLLLIADDSMFQRFTLAKVARGMGIDVLEARTGLECLEQFCRHAPDAICLDLNMPDMTGFEVLEALANLAEQTNQTTPTGQAGAVRVPPVAVITADIQDTTRQRVQRHPFVTLFNKPLPEQTLKDFLHHALF